LTVRKALSSGGGAQAQPIFQPVTLNVLPALEIAIAHAWQRRHRYMSTSVEGEVLVHLVGDNDQIVRSGGGGDVLQLGRREHLSGRIVR
jgi:hypothetical protein